MVGVVEVDPAVGVVEVVVVAAVMEVVDELPTPAVEDHRGGTGGDDDNLSNSVDRVMVCVGAGGKVLLRVGGTGRAFPRVRVWDVIVGSTSKSFDTQHKPH